MEILLHNHQRIALTPTSINILHNMEPGNIRSILARARAIHLAMHHGAISYERAHELTDPLLEDINIYIVKTAKRLNQRPKKLVFQDLGRTF